MKSISFQIEQLEVWLVIPSKAHRSPSSSTNFSSPSWSLQENSFSMRQPTSN